MSNFDTRATTVAPMRPHTRDIDGLAIRYAESDDPGTGSTVLLTSPWPESLLAFRRIWPTLKTRARLVAIDLPGFGHSEGRAGLFTPEAMASFLNQLIDDFGLEAPHLVAPDIGTTAALILAARYPGAVSSMVIGGGAAAVPLDVTGVLADIIAAPGIDVFAGQDIRATIGATVEPVASRAREPEVWEDYVSSYEGGRFAESTQYVRSYPGQLPLVAALLPEVGIPVHVVYGEHDSLVPPSNGRYLAQRLQAGQLSILDAGHFCWEEVPRQYAALVRDMIDRAEAAPKRADD